jgi:hypothetical protein
MKIIRPITITDAMMTSSNVPDVAAIGTSTTSLAIGTGSKTFTTQASLPIIAGEWMKAASAADNANYMYGKVTSYTGTTLVINVSVVGGSGTKTDWQIAYGWDVGATYLAADRAQVASTHKIYESLAGANVGHDPVVDCALAVPLYWKEVSATNRWKAFDNKVGSQTSQATSITYRITAGLQFDSIAFLNLDAVSVQAVLTDPVDGEVYNETVDLLATGASGVYSIIDWYTYFFSSVIKATDCVMFDIPPYLNAVLDITITYTGGTAKVGGIMLGLKTTIGNTLYGVGVGIRDYSQKEADDYGVYSIVEGPFSKRMSVDMTMVNTIIDEVSRLFAMYRAIPIVWVADESYSCLIIYGFFKDFEIVIPGPVKSECSLEIEGLT